MKPKIILFDLETTDLNANFGTLLCGAWKVVGEKKVHCVSIDQSPTYKKRPHDDKWVTKRLGEELAKADVLVGWYSSKFDYPFIQSKLLYHNLDPLPPIPHVDGWRVARYKMKLHSNRLQAVSEFFDFADKTPLKTGIWKKAGTGDKGSLKYIIKHCKQDIVVLEQVYLKIRPLITTHPNVNIVNDVSDACPICGTVGRMQKRGYNIARTSRSRRYQCRSCGGWSRGKPERAKNVEIR